MRAVTAERGVARARARGGRGEDREDREEGDEEKREGEKIGAAGDERRAGRRDRAEGRGRTRTRGRACPREIWPAPFSARAGVCAGATRDAVPRSLSLFSYFPFSLSLFFFRSCARARAPREQCGHLLSSLLSPRSRRRGVSASSCRAFPPCSTRTDGDGDGDGGRARARARVLPATRRRCTRGDTNIFFLLLFTDNRETWTVATT